MKGACHLPLAVWEASACLWNAYKDLRLLREPIPPTALKLRRGLKVWHFDIGNNYIVYLNSEEDWKRAFSKRLEAYSLKNTGLDLGLPWHETKQLSSIRKKKPKHWVWVFRRCEFWKCCVYTPVWLSYRRHLSAKH